MTREEKLEEALRQLVYKDENGCWCTSIRGDEDVTDIVGEVLDAPKN